MCQAGNYACFNRVSRDYHNGNFMCRLFRGQCTWIVERNDDIDLEPDKLGCKDGKLIQLSFRGSKFKRNVFPFHVAEFAQPIAELVLEQLGVSETYVERAYLRYLGFFGNSSKRQTGDAANE